MTRARRDRVGRRDFRVYLHPPEARDAAEYLAYCEANRAFHQPWNYGPKDLDGARAYTARARNPRQAPRLIRRVEDDSLVGAANLSEIVRGGFWNAFLGYHCASAHAGQGLMKEALWLALDHGFSEIGLHRVEANIQPGNEASRRLVQRLGFRLEGFSPRYLKIGGRWRDHERWALLAEEWKTIRKEAAQRTQA